MTTAFRIIITAVLVGVIGSQINFDTRNRAAADDSVVVAFTRRPVDSTEATTPESLVVDNATAEQVELVIDAVATFTRAGLELPPLVVTFDATGETCKGHPGLFRHVTPATVVICDPSRHVLLHELAHAWEWHMVDDSARDDFVHDLRLETWNSKDIAWDDRGVEQFADTVAIGFVLQHRSDNPTVIERLCTFEHITGTEHPALTDGDCEV